MSTQHVPGSAPAPAKVAVALGDRSYDVVVGSGLLEQFGLLAGPVLGKRRRIIVVTDENVAAAGHLARLTAGASAAGIAVDAIVLPPGEQSKSWAQLAALCDQLLALKLDRGTMLAALGGGIIGDLLGFAAAIAMRGVDFIQIPTSLLAMVDSSVGGKTGINTAAGKNMVGAFHQPRLVLADLDALATLPARELRAGYAEVVKHAVIRDAAFFDRLETLGPDLLAGDVAAQREAVLHSVNTKAAVVAADEREGGIRALLNFGHTFGHALEAETGMSDALVHGEAVAIGMVQALDLSAALGYAPAGDVARLQAHLARCGLPSRLADAPGAPFAPDRLLAHMAGDKKARDGVLTFVLARGIGDAFIADGVDAAAVRARLALG